VTGWRAQLRLAWTYARPDAARFGAALALAPVVAALGLVQPLILQRALDEHLVTGQAAGLQWLAGLYLGAVVLAYGAEAAYTLFLAAGAENSILRVRKALFRQMLSLSQRFYERQPTGQLMTRATSDVDALNEALAAGSVSMVLDVLVLLGTLGAMAVLDWKLTLVVLAVAPPIVAVLEFCRRRMRGLYAEIRDALAALNAFTAERIAGVEVIQLEGLEGRTRARFRALDERHRDANVMNNVYDAALYAFIDGVASVCIALMLWWGSREAAGAAVTVGLVVAFVDYIDRLFRPLREFSGKITFLQRAAAGIEKIGWLLGVEDRIGAGTRDLPEPRGHLRLRGVSFAYGPGAPDVLKDVDIEVRPGEVVAVVGRTGAGKSTLFRVLARVHDGYRGSIEIDGVELREVTPQSLRRALAVVRQEVQVFRDTLRFNVTLGDPDLDPARVHAAITQSNVGVLAACYPEGLDHAVRERGTDISAGEAQLIALARALARDPALVLLDEATASVDPVTEQLVQDALGRLFADRTCLVIAHRLSTVLGADRVAVVEAGRIVELGTHAELEALGGAYARLRAEGFGAAPVRESA
jgi:ATP-binding cassette subfamily B protein